MNKNCVPIPNAVVWLWQRNNTCHNQQSPDIRKQVHKQGFKATHTHAQYFVGNGTATTDNTGYFRFITIAPCSDNCSLRKSHSYIELSVKHGYFIRFDASIDLPSVRMENGKFYTENCNSENEFMAEFTGCIQNIRTFRYDIALNENKGYRKY